MGIASNIGKIEAVAAGTAGVVMTGISQVKNLKDREIGDKMDSVGFS